MQEGHFAFDPVMAAHRSAVVPCWELARGHQVDPDQEQLRSNHQVPHLG